MKTVSFDGTIGTAFDKTEIKPALPFAGTYEAYENYSDVPTDEKLSEKDILEVVNTARKNAARAKEIKSALLAAGYKEVDRKSPEFQRNEMVANLMKQRPKLTREQAETVVDGMLGNIPS